MLKKKSNKVEKAEEKKDIRVCAADLEKEITVKIGEIGSIAIDLAAKISEETNDTRVFLFLAKFGTDIVEELVKRYNR